MTDGSSPSHAARRFLGHSLGVWSSPSLAAERRQLQCELGEGTAAAPQPLGATLAGKAQESRGAAACSIPLSAVGIRAFHGSGAGSGGAAKETAAAALQEALQTDYRAQLKQYAQQLAAKEGEAARLRQQLQDLKQQLGASFSSLQDADEQAARSAAQVAQLERHVLVLEEQLQRREQDAGLAGRQQQAAEQEAAAAKAQVAAAQKSTASKCAEWEESRRYYKEQLEVKEAHIKRLEETIQRQAADAERKVRDWAQREVDLSLTHTQNKDSTAALKSQLSIVQDKLEQALKRARVAEASGAELRRQKAQMLADMKMLEDLLADSDNGRREMHEKYVVMGERMEALVREEQVVKETAQLESEAARLAVQEAVRDAELAIKERAILTKKIQELKEQLEAEQASRGKLQDKVKRKLAAAEQEVAFLKVELESKAKQLKGLQADMKSIRGDAENKLDACEAQMANLRSRITVLTRELDLEKKRSAQVREEADALWQERLKVEQQQQSLKYERRIQELEVQYLQQAGGGAAALPRLLSAGAGGGGAAITASILDYIPRSEHMRVLESRLAAKESDMTVELNSRINQTEREWQWKLEGKEQEINSLTARARQLEDNLHSERQRSASHSHKLSDENKRLQSQCVELQRDLEAAQKQFARLKESLKDARLANAGMDDDQMAASRQATRLKHALEEAHSALREAQSAVEKERKHAEGCEREVEQHKARLEEVYRKAARLEGEAAELTAALEQKQEVIVALQNENAGWNAKLMAHREWHDQEVETLRRQLKQEGEEKLAPLEQQCSMLAAELRELKQRHELELGTQGAEHAARVAQLEKQLAAAERCAAELKELSASLTGVKQEDMEMLKGHVQDLQLKLKEVHPQRGKERREHQAQLASLEAHIRAKLTAFKTQHRIFRAQVQGDVAQACTDCLHDCESGLASLQQQMADRSAAAAHAQDASAANTAHLKDNLLRLVSVVSEQCSLPAILGQVLAAGVGSTSDGEVAAKALQQVGEAICQHVHTCKAAAADAALCPLEECLLAEDAAANSSEETRRARHGVQLRGPADSAIARLGSHSPKKQQEGATAASSLLPSQQPCKAEHAASLAIEDIAVRTEALVSRCRELLTNLAANEEQIRQQQQKMAFFDDAMAKAKAESVQAGESVQEAAMAPLRQEVQRLEGRVRELQRQYTAEVADIKVLAKQEVVETQARAQNALDKAASQAQRLQQELELERQRGDGAAAEAARAQDELAKHAQRAASKIELQDMALILLKERMREMELRDQQTAEELRLLRQRERDAQANSIRG